jgi:hypothetical protein
MTPKISMTPGILRRRNRKARAHAQPSQETEMIETTDEITCSLIDTFPASDPPAWTATARVGTPKRPTTFRAARKARHPDRHDDSSSN